MKVFVYHKGSESEKITMLTDVIAVREDKTVNEIIFETMDLNIMFDTRYVKCTIYQN